ncbi:MAG: hypothetical protein ABI196_03620 [Bradyrhizobium sp.]
MSLFITAVKELWRLFVDDGKLAALTLAWLGIVALIAHLGGAVTGALLAGLWPVGLVVILIQGVVRAATRPARQKGEAE